MKVDRNTGQLRPASRHAKEQVTFAGCPKGGKNDLVSPIVTNITSSIGSKKGTEMRASDSKSNWELLKEQLGDHKKKGKKANHRREKMNIPAKDGSTVSRQAQSENVSRKARMKGAKRHREDGDLQTNIVLGEGITGNLTRVLGLDCEMVGAGVAGTKSLLARVSIVNAHGDIVYDTFVSPTEQVTDFRTSWSGVRPKDLKGAPRKDEVVQKVKMLVSGRILVGHALQNDFEALSLSHPESHVRDSAKYPPFMKRLISGKVKPRALRHVVAEELDMVIQTGEHDSVQDAKAVLGLYHKHKHRWEEWIKKSGRHKKRRVEHGGT